MGGYPMNILRALFSFYGRFNRGEFATIFFGSILLIIAGVVGLAVVSKNPGGVSFIVGWILAMKWAAFAALAKRFHDIDWRGTACLFILIPFVGFVVPLVMLFVEGSQGVNQYGAATGFFTRRGVKIPATA
jgi:uncharacterized membrane protein YhaH (DUF805 family)